LGAQGRQVRDRVNVLNLNLAANGAIKRPKQEPAPGEDASYRVLIGKVLADHIMEVHGKSPKLNSATSRRPLRSTFA
jgi:hypothetical protein